ncbi:MAG: T9SS type A sorting domain-containing protein [Ignavibacteriales bacterium]|nr:T9SS type A sorting domain-containing protein [Ignavibacteriales bacterium]
MKYFLILFLSLIATTLCFAQTELWRINGQYNINKPADNGSIYLAHGIGTSPDTIKKISSDGVTIWEKEFKSSINQFLTHDGNFYILFHSSIYQDSVTYFDKNGERLWTLNYPASYASDRASIDQNGNLYFFLNYDSPYGRLCKLDSTGTWKFQGEIPIIPIIDEWGADFYGPFVDNNKVWLIAYVLKNDYIEKRNTWYDNDSLHTIVFQFDANTGSYISYTKALKVLTRMEKGDTKGNSTTFEAYDCPYTIYETYTVSGNLILAGTYSTSMYKTNVRENLTGEEKSEWHLLITNPDGKSKLFKYKGKGYYQEKEPGSSVKYNGNYLAHVGIGKNSMIYLSGEIAMGKEVNGIGTGYYTTGALIKYNVAKKKSMWVKKDFGGGNCWVTQSQHVMIMGSSGISICDSNGNESTTRLSFADIIAKIPKELNTRDDQIFLNMNRLWPSSPYFAKYSLAPLQFQKNIVDNLEKPFEYSLDQNYPNPFNPTTTIKFTLQEELNVTLKVFNTLGQEVATILNNEFLEEGEHEIEFNAGSLASGVYFYRIDAGSFIDTKKFILIR